MRREQSEDRNLKLGESFSRKNLELQVWEKERDLLRLYRLSLNLVADFMSMDRNQLLITIAVCKTITAQFLFI